MSLINIFFTKKYATLTGIFFFTKQGGNGCWGWGGVMTALNLSDSVISNLSRLK